MISQNIRRRHYTMLARDPSSFMGTNDKYRSDPEKTALGQIDLSKEEQTTIKI